MFRSKLLPAVVLAMATLPAFSADSVDFSTLTTSISFTGVVAAILAVAAVKVLPLVAMWGGKAILGMIRGS